MAFNFKAVGKWSLVVLRVLGLAAEAAKDTAPVFTKNQKDLANIDKAAAAGGAAEKLADSIEKATDASN